MADIFISYERSDYARAQRIAEALGQHGWSVWWDRMLLAGDRFDKAIQQALHTAKCVIVLWSKTSISSDWVKDEAFEGAKRGILVPVLIDDVEMPFGFRQMHAARLTNWETASLPPEFREILDSIKQLLDRPVTPGITLVDAVPTSEVPGREETAPPGQSPIVGVATSKRKPKSQWWAFRVPRVLTLVVITIFGFGLVGVLVYFLRQGTPQANKSLSKISSDITADSKAYKSPTEARTQPNPPSAQVSQEAETSKSLLNAKGKVELISLTRFEVDRVIVRYKYTYQGSSVIWIGDMTGVPTTTNPGSYVSFLDPINKRRHFTIVDPNKDESLSENISGIIGPNETRAGWSMLNGPPQDVRTVTVYLPGASPFENVLVK